MKTLNSKVWEEKFEDLQPQGPPVRVPCSCGCKGGGCYDSIYCYT